LISIDKSTIFLEIEKRRPSRIVLNAPDGLLIKTKELALEIEKKFGIDTITILNPCYGVCDIVDEEAKKLQADIAFHIGHGISERKIGKRTVLIDAFDEIKFNKALKNALPTLIRCKKIGLVTISQHLHKIENVKKVLERNRVKVFIGKGRGRLTDGQVFGCDFSTAYSIRHKVTAFVFLGQSKFHCLGVTLATNKPCFMLDPYYNELVNISEDVPKIKKKSILTILRAKEASNFGIIIGLKEGQMKINKALKIKKNLERHDKKVALLALHEITDERIIQLHEIEAFIQTACPRISIEQVFQKPVLSIPQAETLISVLDGKNNFDSFLKSNWL
jgi:2-(3-amino-3-carboxypropyl)histidine synthase